MDDFAGSIITHMPTCSALRASNIRGYSRITQGHYHKVTMLKTLLITFLKKTLPFKKNVISLHHKTNGNNNL